MARGAQVTHCENVFAVVGLRQADDIQGAALPDTADVYDPSNSTAAAVMPGKNANGTSMADTALTDQVAVGLPKTTVAAVMPSKNANGTRIADITLPDQRAFGTPKTLLPLSNQVKVSSMWESLMLRCRDSLLPVCKTLSPLLLGPGQSTNGETNATQSAVEKSTQIAAQSPVESHALSSQPVPPLGARSQEPDVAESSVTSHCLSSWSVPPSRVLFSIFSEHTSLL